MENLIDIISPILVKVIISVIGIFSIIIVITRISGLRTFAKLSTIDFASTIAIGSILATVIMHSDQSILKGAIALGSVVAFQSILSFTLRKSKPIRNLLSNNPMLLMYEGKILEDNLVKTNVSKDELIAKLRAANTIHFDQVLAVVLETTGDISVMHSTKHNQLMPIMLKGVRGIPNHLNNPQHIID